MKMEWKKTIGGFILILLSIILLNIKLPNMEVIIFNSLKVGTLIIGIGIMGVIAGAIIFVLGLLENPENNRRR
jgi:hypothetical protein